MPGENPLPELKLNLWMPLDLGPFLQDTAHLSTEEIGAYILLLIYYWAHGPLPNDPKRLANIAKIPIDTWSNTQEALSMYFFVGSDGLLHQKGADRRRAQWLDKRLKAREKAIKAITARWSKHRAKLASTSDTPSIREEIRGEILEHYPTSVIQEQKQILPTPTPPTPSAQVGIEKPSSRSRKKTPRQLGVSPRQLGRSLRQLGKSPRQLKSVEEAKQGKNDSEAIGEFPNGADAGQVHPGGENARAGGAGAAAKGKILDSDPQKVDPREYEIKSEVLAYWAGQNPDGPELHFNRADDRAFAALLRDHPELNLATVKKLLRNRAQSLINPTSAPHKWLRNLFEYAAGPLGKYGKPLSRPRLI